MTASSLCLAGADRPNPVRGSERAWRLDVDCVDDCLISNSWDIIAIGSLWLACFWQDIREGSLFSFRFGSNGYFAPTHDVTALGCIGLREGYWSESPVDSIVFRRKLDVSKVAVTSLVFVELGLRSLRVQRVFRKRWQLWVQESLEWLRGSVCRIFRHTFVVELVVRQGL